VTDDDITTELLDEDGGWTLTVSQGLIDGLQHLIDEYGYAGVGRTLMEMVRPNLEAERDRLRAADEVDQAQQ